jgi:hypothetical protein
MACKCVYVCAFGGGGAWQASTPLPVMPTSCMAAERLRKIQACQQPPYAPDCCLQPRAAPLTVNSASSSRAPPSAASEPWLRLRLNRSLCSVSSLLITFTWGHMCRVCVMGVFVTREHVRHNKSGITHRGKTRISH